MSTASPLNETKRPARDIGQVCCSVIVAAPNKRTNLDPMRIFTCSTSMRKLMITKAAVWNDKKVGTQSESTDHILITIRIS